MIGVITSQVILYQNHSEQEISEKIYHMCPPMTERCRAFTEITSEISNDYSFQFFVTEAIATCIFVSLAMSVKFYTPSQNSLVGAMSSSLTLYGLLKMILNITGGCLNPAVGTVQPIFQFYSDPLTTIYTKA